jgi:hypothetical protein
MRTLRREVGGGWKHCIGRPAGDPRDTECVADKLSRCRVRAALLLLDAPLVPRYVRPIPGRCCLNSPEARAGGGKERLERTESERPTTGRTLRPGPLSPKRELTRRTRPRKRE